MEFKVGDKYRISTDRYNWMFQEYKSTSVDKDGKERDNWDTWGYWGTLEQLAKHIPDLILRRQVGTVDDVMPEYHRIVGLLLKAVRQAQEECEEILA